MAIRERTGRKVDGRTAEREYIITGESSDANARAALIAHVSDTISVSGITYNLNEAACGVEEILTKSNNGVDISDGVWIGTAVWESPQGLTPTGSFTLSFDISGQSTRITHSRQTVNAYPTALTTKPNFKQAINVQADGTVEGVDILIPYFTYTLTKTFDESTIAGGWVLTAANIVGTVNSSEFHGFQAGELLLTRISGQQRPDGDWDVTFSFAVSFNEAGLAVGDITGISKDGWDYLWVYYEETHDTTTKRTHKIPVSAYVERVYRRTSYAALSI